MSSVTGHTTAQPERPERSRNAKAQARHRAKRKAYIEQLEQTVTKLQTALGFSPEQVAALPPPLVKIRELEQENLRLQKENEDLRRMLSDNGGRLSLDLSRRNSLASFHDSRNICDRDYKRRKMSGNVDEVYMHTTDTSHDSLARPPPLTIPQPLHQYGNGVPHGSHHHNSQSNNSLFTLHGPGFQMPNTPSGSSATSSPPFSATSMQHTTSHSSVNHRQNVSSHHVIPNYAQQTNHYGSVKVEDENYVPSNHHNSHTNHSATHYPTLPSYGTTTTDNLETWHYSSERALPR
ncbi:hypothetical protein BDN72DRAFT_871065 [Pluteus cervinus]|uniref:Uncharacterized protein n=1 Tax=Pluteus cervinus TaxID=181527 RepID=A0ACD3ARJ4_9AGAR|nr:hypothetical protein BDN72DRAFT_871065 [Pluteus cervinus]